MKRLHSAFVIAALVLGSALFHAQQLSSQNNPGNVRASITVDARQVITDVVARGADGNFVDIEPTEWKIFEDGREQTLVSVDHHVRERTPEAKLLAPGWTNNREQQALHGESRTHILLMDVLNMKTQEQLLARDFAKKALNEIPDGERFVLFLLGNKLTQLSGFSDDRKALQKALDRYTIQNNQLQDKDPVTNIGVGMEHHALSADNTTLGSGFNSMEVYVGTHALMYRAGYTLDALKQIASIIERQPGRKSLIWLTSGFPLNLEPFGGSPDEQNSEGRTTVVPMMPKSEERIDPFLQTDAYARRLDEVLRRLSSARVAVYPILVSSLNSGMSVDNPSNSVQFAVRNPGSGTFFNQNGTTDRDASIAQARRTAEGTGGRATVNSNDIVGDFRRAVDDATNYYTLSFAPANREFKGEFRRIEIRTTKPGVTLQFRPGYYAIGEPARLTGAPLDSALELDVPLSEEIETAARIDDDERVELRLGIDGLVVQPADSGFRKIALLVGYVKAPRDGTKPLRSRTNVDILLNQKQFEAAVKTGISLTLHISGGGHSSLVRAGVQDRLSGRVGTVDLNFAIPPVARIGNPVKEEHPHTRNILPEQGRLTGNTYENAYYGFRLELPKSVAKKQQRLGVMPQGIHALLALELENHLHKGILAAYATEPSSGEAVDGMIAAREEASKASKLGMTLLEGPMERSNKDGRYWVLLEQGPEPLRRTLIYFVPRRDALLKFAGTSDDDELFKNMSISLKRLAFTEEGAETSAEHSYLGPAIPDRWVEDAIASKSGAAFADPGGFSSDGYKNDALGLDFKMPSGWEAVDLTAGNAAYEMSHRADVDDKSAVREHQLFQACSRPLFYMREKKPEDEAQTVALLVADQNCLHLPFPSKNDVSKMTDFATALSLLQDFGEPRHAGMVKVDGRPFVTLRGELSFPGPDPKLQVRRWQTAYVTGVGNHLLVWFWSYPRSGMKDEAILSNIRLK